MFVVVVQNADGVQNPRDSDGDGLKDYEWVKDSELKCYLLKGTRSRLNGKIEKYIFLISCSYLNELYLVSKQSEYEKLTSFHSHAV